MMIRSNNIFSTLLVAAVAAALASGCKAVMPVRNFMAHRGVHLGYTIAGENSLEAVDFARRAGFQSIETDCRYTSDSVLVIIHDDCLNRTFTKADGSSIGPSKVAVADLTLDDIRRNYKLKADREEFRSPIPTLEEYLTRCRENGLMVYIEPKLYDSTGRYYLDIMKVADKVLGRDGYVICSNNFANGIIRNVLGIKDVKLMGLLFQTTWEEMDALGNITFALNPTKFDAQTFHSLVERTHVEGKPNESASGLRSMDSDTRLRCFNLLYDEGEKIDVIATDLNTPDWHGQGKTVAKFKAATPEQLSEKVSALPLKEFYGLYIDMEYQGAATLEVGPESFRIDESYNGHVAYQRSVYNSSPHIAVKDTDDNFRIMSCRVRIVEM